MIFRLRADGLGQRAIATRLNELKIPSPFAASATTLAELVARHGTPHVATAEIYRRLDLEQEPVSQEESSR